MAGIYVHIPYCKSKCVYCDFYSVVASVVPARRYVHSVIQEAMLRREELNESVTTLYLGGGTPSALSHTELQTLINGLREVLNLNEIQEFTVEVNPDDVNSELVQALTELGVNRVSMGVQSLDDDDLRFMRRRHTAREALNAIALLKTGGITNVSVDFIYGVPGQTLESWNRTLDVLAKTDVEHVSAYNLSYEEGTPLWKMRECGQVKEISDELAVAMFDLLCTRLGEAGFEHYEISNFAKPGYYSRHNSSYWQGVPYLGLGAAAHSYDGRATRSFNPADVKRYVENVDGGVTVCEREYLSTRELHDEMVMLRLRTACGLDVAEVERLFGLEASRAIERKAAPFVSGGLLKCTGRVYSFTRQGIAVSNMVMSELMAD